MTKHCYDIIIIGSGAGGSTLAYQLSGSGHRILVVERGDFMKPEPRRMSDPVGKYMYHIIKDREQASYFVGGETKFYGSALYRMRESDFEAVQHENGVSPAWPIMYPDLEPYYHQAEVLYRVHGSTEGDISEPPRANAFPHPPIEHAPIVSQLVNRINRSGVQVSAIPLGLDYGPLGKCVLCSTCDAHYCQLDAKMDAEIAALRPALATGNVQLMTQTECVRVLTTPDGARVNGVLLRRAGQEQIVHANIVAVCAGVTGSPSLLRRSRHESHPEGIGNNTGCLGRYLAGHSAGLLFLLTGFQSVSPAFTKTFAINHYYHGTADWPYPIGTIQAGGQIPFWEQTSKFTRPFARLVGTHALTCFYMTEALPNYNTRLVFDGDEIVGRVPPVHNLRTFKKLHGLAVDIFRRSGYRFFSRRRPRVWHEVGTARFGTDRTTSVVDQNLQVHGVKGLFVVDASVLPSAGAVNPTLTIIALALRAGDHLSRHFD